MSIEAEMIGKIEESKEEVEAYKKAIRIQHELLNKSVEKNIEILKDYDELKEKVFEIDEKFEEKIKELKKLQEMRKKQEERIENLINKINKVSNLLEHVKELKSKNEKL